MFETLANSSIFIPFFSYFNSLVDGGLSEWGSWSSYQEPSSELIQRRFKSCNNPQPKCGGNRCDINVKTVEEKETFAHKGIFLITLQSIFSKSNTHKKKEKKNNNNNKEEQEAVKSFSIFGV